MDKELMTGRQTTTAAMNLDMLEAQLGRKIPTDAIDVSQLGDRLLTNREVVNMAMNIDSVEKNREARREYGGYLLIALIIFLIIYFAAGLIVTIFE